MLKAERGLLVSFSDMRAKTSWTDVKALEGAGAEKKIEKENFTDVSDAIAAFHLVFLFFFFSA